MKKILNIIAVFGTIIALSSCDLNLKPITTLPGEDAATLEFVVAQRAGVYGGLKAVTSGEFLYDADYYVDLVNETTNSGNRGAYFYNWTIYSNDQSINTIWSNYYGFINRINYAIMKSQEAIENGYDKTTIEAYIGEFRFLRAYTFHQLALRFCQDYDPAKATTQMGVPTPVTYNPEAQLNRGTLADVYKRINEDVQAAEAVVTTTGAANAIYLTVDAITAFKAQVALQMHDYTNAIAYAKSLYSAYPLISSKVDLERMWREDSSTETIFQPEVKTTSLGTVGSMSDYYMGTWSAAINNYLCAPAYVLEDWPVKLYSGDDYRMDIYVALSTISLSSTNKGYLMNKFMGNKLLQTSLTILAYRNMPKIFRIAEMYLIEAEAQYRMNGDALTPLNALRQSRGLAAGNETGTALFQAIKDERVREMIGEGQRLTDLKRWNDGFKRDTQSALKSVLSTNGRHSLQKSAGDNGFVWPIPLEEMSKNPNIGSQNPGY